MISVPVDLLCLTVLWSLVAAAQQVAAAMVATAVLLVVLTVCHLQRRRIPDRVVLEQLNLPVELREQGDLIVVPQMVAPELSVLAVMAVVRTGVTIGTAPAEVAVTTAAEAAVQAVTVAPVAADPVGSVLQSPAAFRMHWPRQ